MDPARKKSNRFQAKHAQHAMACTHDALIIQESSRLIDNWYR